MQAMLRKESEPKLKDDNLRLAAETIFDRFEQEIPAMLLSREPLYDARSYMNPPLLEFNEVNNGENILYIVKRGGIIDGERYDKRWLLIKRSFETHIDEESTVILDFKGGPTFHHSKTNLRNSANPTKVSDTMTAFSRIITMLDSLPKKPQ